MSNVKFEMSSGDSENDLFIKNFALVAEKYDIDIFKAVENNSNMFITKETSMVLDVADAISKFFALYIRKVSDITMDMVGYSFVIKGEPYVLFVNNDSRKLESYSGFNDKLMNIVMLQHDDLIKADETIKSLELKNDELKSQINSFTDKDTEFAAFVNNVYSRLFLNKNVIPKHYSSNF